MAFVIIVAVVAFVVIALFKRDQAKIQKRNINAPAYRGQITEIYDDSQKLACPAWVVLDVETTGLHPESDRIIEFAARRYRNGVIESEYSTLVFPDQRLPEKITELTGIQDKQLLRAPRFDEIAQKIVEMIGGLPIVAHNAKFDAEFLVYECARQKITLDVNYIDTVRLARLAFPGLENYKLNTLIHELNLLDHGQEHRAMSDVDATARLYLLCRERIPAMQKIAAEEQEREKEQERLEREKERLEEKAYNLNQYGIQAEAAGDVEKASRYYEDIITEKMSMPNAYMRLAIIYKKQKRWEDVVRVCDAALVVLPGRPGKLCQPEEYEKRKAYALAKLTDTSVKQ